MPRKQTLSPLRIARLWLGQHYVKMLPQFFSRDYRGFMLRKIRDRLSQKMATVSGSVALPEIPAKTMRRLAVATPHLIAAGAERFLEMATKGLAADGWDIVIVKTEWHPSHLHASDHWFGHCRAIAAAGHLDAAELAVYLHGLQPDLLWIVNSAKTYAALPALKQLQPSLHVVDSLFNAHDFHYTNYRMRELIDATTCENAIIARQLRERFGATHPVEQIANGVDLSVFKPARNEAPGRFTVGFCGRLSPVKNAKFMLELARHLPGADILIAGEGPLLEEMQRDKPDNCELLGNLSDVPAFLNHCDVLIVPSLMDGRPNIVMEAMACGTPVLATNVGAIPEMVKAEYLFAVNDTPGLVATLGALMRHPDSLAQLKQECAAYAAAHFNVQDFQRAYNQLFGTLLLQVKPA